MRGAEVPGDGFMVARGENCQEMTGAGCRREVSGPVQDLQGGK